MAPEPDHQTARERVLRAAELATEEQARALALAEERGRTAAKVDAHLAEHDRHFLAINGAVERTAGELTALGKQVGGIVGQLAQSAALAAQRDEQLKKASESHVSTRTFVLGLVGTVIAVAALLVSALAFLGQIA